MAAWLAVLACLSAAMTWLARRYALARNLVDQPGERRSHSDATPRGGGIAIVLVLLAAAGALFLRYPGEALRLVLVSVGLLLVAGIGLFDDHRPLSPWLRLAVHALAALLPAGAVGLHAGSAWAAGGTFVLVIALTNVWNFMDGINGIAAIQAALVAFLLATVSGGAWSWLALAMLAACVGFLPFNFPRARIFLGDVGSGAIGYVIAVLAALALESHGRAWPVILLPLLVFLVDAGLTLLRRMLAGERWWTPHTQHAYQAAARRFGHAPVALAYAAAAAAVGGLAIAALALDPEARIAIALVCLIGLSIGWWTVQRMAGRAAVRTGPNMEQESGQ